jgi:hypothetical protein
MKKIFVFLFLFCTLYAASSNYSKWYGGFIQNKNVKPVIKTPLPHLSPEEFPTNFWWGNVSGVNYHTYNSTKSAYSNLLWGVLGIFSNKRHE